MPRVKKPDEPTTPQDEPMTAAEITQDGAEYAKEVESAFAKRSRAERARRLDATDSEFWCAFYFQNRAQKEEFIKLFNLDSLGDKYIDGVIATRRVKKVLRTPTPERMPSSRIDPKYAELALEITTDVE